ncbi:MAG: Fic family protein [Leptolyngbya sp.]|nr:MAG: Fic family protein [Leptolyngbya sp.]
MNQATFYLIDQLKAELDFCRPLPTPVVSKLEKVYTVQYTYNSNAIEGNTLTQRETEMVLEKGITVGGKTLVEHLEVIGHRDAVRYIEALAQSKAPNQFTEWEIRQIHNLIMRSVSPDEAGQYRNLDVRSAGTVYHYPTAFLVPALTKDLIDWLHLSTSSLHPVEYAAIAHLKLVTIHPFRDGNGRTARLVMNLILISQEYPIVSIPSEKWAEYIDVIVEAQQNHKKQLFVELVLHSTVQSLQDTLEVVRSSTG